MTCEMLKIAALKWLLIDIWTLHNEPKILRKAYSIRSQQTHNSGVWVLWACWDYRDATARLAVCGFVVLIATRLGKNEQCNRTLILVQRSAFNSTYLECFIRADGWVPDHFPHLGRCNEWRASSECLLWGGSAEIAGTVNDGRILSATSWAVLACQQRRLLLSNINESYRGI